MTPAHRFAKDQAVALAKLILGLMERRYVTATHIRDGMENLHFLGMYWKDIDESVARVRLSMPICIPLFAALLVIFVSEACRELFRRTLATNICVSLPQGIGEDLCLLLDALEPLIHIVEKACNLPSTDWDRVGDTIRADLILPCAEHVDSCTPLMKYFVLGKLLGEKTFFYFGLFPLQFELPREISGRILGAVLLLSTVKPRYGLNYSFTGAGGFGAVYKALFGEAVCTVKLVPKSKLPGAEFAIVDKEVSSMINHPCLVHYHATFVTEEAYVTVMEYIKGVDVIRLLQANTRLSEGFAKLILAQLGLALCHLHYKGFLHRDVKVRFHSRTPSIISVNLDHSQAKL